MKQSPLQKPIVASSEPITLIGGADIADETLNMCLRVAPSVVAADGGADRLVVTGIPPLAVIGDMDSLSAQARATHRDVIHAVSEQDTTDFEKCLTRITAPVVLAAGFLGARLDHTLATLATLARLQAHHVVLVSDSEVCVLARQGRSRIAVTPQTRVAVMPLGAATVSSTGLVWDMDALGLAPDAVVSSSNRAQAEHVTLDVAGPVLITLERSELSGAQDYALGR
ncbi:hypothetical protein AN189_16210 [Loktanella sp. 3ANDIMAR09]|uniref:thiamine diphosphokinase n=1 Tax=Loktanella sp. 3ANDIMAR09 TaxID=1225657 RepID=UPI00070069BF|nr:thiamine diphosphokinase [Loktanella sp. 3ANDIMAR09]KQI67303.1 hypothetical protein AN189_16210 [Loktanella sp. 3ANDIMAR09]